MAVSNILFQATRVYNTRKIAENNIPIVVLSGFFVKTLWLISTALGIKGALEWNILYIVVYLVTGVLGDLIGMKYKQTK